MLVLNFAFPVYAVTVLGLPGWVTGAIFTINTVMVGFGQGLVRERQLTGRTRWRVIVGSPRLFFAARYLLMLGIGDAAGVVAGTVLILVGAVVYTMGELTGGPVHGGDRGRSSAGAPAGPLPVADPDVVGHSGHDHPRGVHVAAGAGHLTHVAGHARADRRRIRARPPARAG